MDTITLMWFGTVIAMVGAIISMIAAFIESHLLGRIAQFVTGLGAGFWLGIVLMTVL